MRSLRTSALLSLPGLGFALVLGFSVAAYGQGLFNNAPSAVGSSRFLKKGARVAASTCESDRRRCICDEGLDGVRLLAYDAEAKRVRQFFECTETCAPGKVMVVMDSHDGKNSIPKCVTSHAGATQSPWKVEGP